MLRGAHHLRECEHGLTGSTCRRSEVGRPDREGGAGCQNLQLTPRLIHGSGFHFHTNSWKKPNHEPRSGLNRLELLAAPSLPVSSQNEGSCSLSSFTDSQTLLLNSQKHLMFVFKLMNTVVGHLHLDSLTFTQQQRSALLCCRRHVL